MLLVEDVPTAQSLQPFRNKSMIISLLWSEVDNGRKQESLTDVADMLLMMTLSSSGMLVIRSGNDREVVAESGSDTQSVLRFC